MNPPKSNIPEIQRRIDRASELMLLQTEEEIYWLRFQAACTQAAKERRGDNVSFRAENEPIKEIDKKD